MQDRFLPALNKPLEARIRDEDQAADEGVATQKTADKIHTCNDVPNSIQLFR